MTGFDFSFPLGLNGRVLETSLFRTRTLKKANPQSFSLRICQTGERKPTEVPNRSIMRGVASPPGSNRLRVFRYPRNAPR